MRAVQHLIAQGRRRIVHVTGPANFRVVRERALAYSEALGAAGSGGYASAEIMRGSWTERWGHEAVATLWSGVERPDGIFCGNDQIARGVVDALRERGVDVPRDVSVVGFDNWEIVAEQTRPPLTTVDMNLKELGRQAGLGACTTRQRRSRAKEDFGSCPAALWFAAHDNFTKVHKAEINNNDQRRRRLKP